MLVCTDDHTSHLIIAYLCACELRKSRYVHVGAYRLFLSSNSVCDHLSRYWLCLSLLLSRYSYSLTPRHAAKGPGYKATTAAVIQAKQYAIYHACDQNYFCMNIMHAWTVMDIAKARNKKFLILRGGGGGGRERMHYTTILTSYQSTINIGQVTTTTT